MTLCDTRDSQLVIVDVQERLAAVIEAERMAAMVRGCVLLLDVAAILEVPVLCTEQYPGGLGTTVTAISDHLPANTSRIPKTCFSGASAADFRQAVLNSGRKQVVLAGIESHVCILQTAMELAQQGQAVFVVEDAVCARHALHHRNAMARMRQAGIVVTNTESVIFEWLRDASHEHFRKISALLKGV
ncbi:MAG: isochorismatase family protein [Pseudomonadota bacterium]